MNMPVRWAPSLVLFMLMSGLYAHLNDAAATPGLSKASRLAPSAVDCENTGAAEQHGYDVVVMGPGGDFAGATVVHVEAAKPASTGILVPGPGGDFAGATVIESTGAEPTAAASTDIVVMGPGGDFAGATVVKSTSAESTGTDQVIMGPGGDFAGATVVHVAAEAAPDGLASTDAHSSCP